MCDNEKNISVSELPSNPAQVAPVTTEALGAMVAELMRPVVETMGRMVQNMHKVMEDNTAALEQLSSAQTVQNNRIEALEKQIRLQTPVTGKQVSYLNGAIKDRARELLDKYQVDDGKAVTKLGSSIRRGLLTQYGVAGLKEIPRHEYTVALHQVELWNQARTVLDVVKEARDRANQDSGQAE